MATFGNLQEGDINSPVQFSPNQKLASPFTIPHSGVLHYLTVNPVGSITGNRLAQVAIFADNSGSPGALLQVSPDIINPLNSGIHTVSFNLTFSAGTLWAGILVDASCGLFNAGLFQNTPYTGLTVVNNNTYSLGFSNPFGSASVVSLHNLAINAVYTPTDLVAGTFYGEITGGPAGSVVGGSPFSFDQLYALRVDPVANGTFDNLIFYMAQNFSSPFVARFMLYNSILSGGILVPNNLLAMTNEVTSFVVNENQVDFSPPVSVNAGTYFITLTSPDLMDTYLGGTEPAFIANSSYSSGPPANFGTSSPAGFLAPTFWATFTPNPPPPISAINVFAST